MPDHATSPTSTLRSNLSNILLLLLATLLLSAQTAAATPDPTPNAKAQPEPHALAKAQPTAPIFVVPNVAPSKIHTLDPENPTQRLGESKPTPTAHPAAQSVSEDGVRDEILERRATPLNPIPSSFGPISLYTQRPSTLTASNAFPYVSLDSAGSNTFSYVAQTTNAGNAPLSVATQAVSSASKKSMESGGSKGRSSKASSSDGKTGTSTMTMVPFETGTGNAGSSVGLKGPAAVVLGAAVLVAGAVL